MVDDFHNLGQLGHFQTTGCGRNIDEHAARTVQRHIIQQRAGNGLIGCHAGTVDTLGITRTHHGDTAITHHGFHICKIEVDDFARTSNHFGNAGNGITQYIVSGTEGFAHGYVFA